MEKAGQQNIQDAFLNTLRREKSTVTINLLHGAAITGRIKSFDKFSVVFDSGNQELLVFKHAIATIGVARRSENAPSGFVSKTTTTLEKK